MQIHSQAIESEKMESNHVSLEMKTLEHSNLI